MNNYPDKTAKSILYFVTEDWYFCSHRLSLAIAAREAGYAVYVVTRVAAHGDIIESAGLNLIPVSLSRRGKNPVVEALFVRQLARIYKRVNPVIVHHIALKPVIYGSFAARIAGVPATVNALAGLGFLFSSGSLLASLLRPTIKWILRYLLNSENSAVILQNPDDLKKLVDGAIVKAERTRLIMGSGVDTEVYRQYDEVAATPIVLLASRLLWDKGVGEFVDAARIIKDKGINARFVIAGDGDPDNPGSIKASQLNEWQHQGYIEYWGRRVDMPQVFAQVHVVCLPTAYGEGVPKVLIEAASCGRPVVTTDSPGCREIVADGENGILVPIKDVDALVNAIVSLLCSSETRVRMGISGRRIVKEKFSLGRVISETLAVYRSLLK